MIISGYLLLSPASFRLKGGMQALTAALKSQIPAEKIKTGHQVVAVSRAGRIPAGAGMGKRTCGRNALSEAGLLGRTGSCGRPCRFVGDRRESGRSERSKKLKAFHTLLFL